MTRDIIAPGVFTTAAPVTLHPLPTSMSVQPLPFMLHTTALSVMTYCYLMLPDVVAGKLMHEMRGGHFQFLTIQGCVSQYSPSIESR